MENVEVSSCQSGLIDQSKGHRFERLKSISQRIVNTGLSEISRLGFSLLAILRQFLRQKLVPLVKHWLAPLMARLKKWEKEMVGAVEKGIEAARVSKPVAGVYEGVDLRVLPKYISFRAALLQNRLTLQYVILILSAVFCLEFAASRFEIHSLHKKLREKEYILAPGVLDFTVAAPQSVSDTYVEHAVTDFLNLLGNVTPTSIDDQYRALSEFMSPQLKMKFQTEAMDVKNKVKSENISELLSVTQKEIRSNGDGYYKVTAVARRDTYVSNEYLGHADEVIEMLMQLVPPKSGKRWYLQINSLTRESANAFRAKSKF